MSQIALFVGVFCKQSFFIFSIDNWVRIFCYRAYVHPQWEKYVIFFVMLSSIKLAIDSYIVKLEDDSIWRNVSSATDLFFSTVFICEMSIKTIALGLIMDQGSYLRDSWNQLDFFIVISSILDMSL
jgi:voltage-dependent calcium channel L type alpha-1D